MFLFFKRKLQYFNKFLSGTLNIFVLRLMRECFCIGVDALSRFSRLTLPKQRDLLFLSVNSMTVCWSRIGPTIKFIVH